MPRFFSQILACWHPASPLWSFLKQKGGSGAEEAGEEKCLTLSNPAQVYTQETKAPNFLLSALNSQRLHLRGVFLECLAERLSMNNPEKRSHLATLHWPWEEPTSFLWLQNSTEATWITWTSSWEGCPGGKNLPWTYLCRQTLGYLHKIAGEGTLWGLLSCGKGFIY